MPFNDIQMDPYYTLDDLQIITVGELRNRVSEIQNQRAQQVAHELWRRLDVIFETHKPGVRRFLRDNRTMYALAGPLGRARLLRYVKRLRSIHFNRILDGIADPALESRLPKTRTYRPGRRKTLHVNLESAARIHTHLESIMYGGQHMPFHTRRDLTCGLLFAVILSAMLSQHKWISVQFVEALWELPTLLIGIGLVYALWYRLTFWVEDKVRIMALYLAFTDQFVDQGAVIDER